MLGNHIKSTKVIQIPKLKVTIFRDQLRNAFRKRAKVKTNYLVIRSPVETEKQTICISFHQEAN